MPATPTWSPPWEEAAWQEDAAEWIDARLEEHGVERLGPLDQFHIEPWSTVMRIETEDGAYFFKAGGPSQHFEPALLQILTRLRPDDSPVLLAVDTERGWAIIADGGQTLRQVIGDSDPTPHFRRLLPQYAEYQIATMGHIDEILAVGCPDRRSEKLPEGYAEVVANESRLMIGDDQILTPADYQDLIAMEPEIEALCQQMTAAGIPPAIEHSDLHTANVFANGDNYTFFDWGDACVSHPFFSLVVTMRSIAGDELNSQDPSLHWARDAYLEPFTQFGTMAELRATFNTAQRLGRFQRGLSWLGELEAIARQHLDEDVENLSAWLWLFLHFPDEKY